MVMDKLQGMLIPKLALSGVIAMPRIVDQEEATMQDIIEMLERVKSKYYPEE